MFFVEDEFPPLLLSRVPPIRVKHVFDHYETLNGRLHSIESSARSREFDTRSP